ncbi:hypothetical protein FGRMN_7123 [Fusarium graminum]|nr:hypothetical protein FGRMN_7123 [Fusarium graminum]
MELKPICQIITPVGMLGYGFDDALTHHELARLILNGVPTAIILDSGSTDSGPQKLALGSMSCPRSAYAKDLAKLLRLVHTFRVPLIFGSAGGDGTSEHVQAMKEVIEEIAAEEDNKDYLFNTILLFSEIPKTTILERFRQGRVTGCGPCVPRTSEFEIEASIRVVAQMGYEPFLDAMNANPDFNVIIGGRAYDPAPYVAYCVFQLMRQSKNINPKDLETSLGGFHHMGKILECGGQCSFPKSHGAVATVYANGLFEVRPTALESRCTPLSVAAHTLYENTRPDVLKGPGGSLYLQDSRYEQLADGRSVRVSGSKYRSSEADGKPYQLKLEAARIVGYRSMFMGSITDHILISQIDSLLPRVKAYVEQQHLEIRDQYDLDFHVYGKGQFTATGPGQLFIVAEAIASTQQLANSIASKARVGMIKATAGNFGFGLGGLMEIELGPCAEFSLYHLMDLKPNEQNLTLGGDEGPLKTLEGSLLHGAIYSIGRGSSWSKGHEFVVPQVNINPPRTNGNVHIEKDTINQDTQKPQTLSDLCRIVRSKNAGPYEITIDAIFSSEIDYQRVKNSELLSPPNVAKALGIHEKDIIWMDFFDPAISFKVTIPRVRSGRKKAAGGFMENDIHGSQEHMGLASLKLSETYFHL